jgi:site-specific recombinase XerD
MAQTRGARMAQKQRERTAKLDAELPAGITIGFRSGGRSKPYFVRYGTPRKTESFTNEGERNDKADALMSAQLKQGSSVFSFDPAEWKEFQEWKAKHKRNVTTVEKAVDSYMALRLSEDVIKNSDTHLHLRKHLQERFAQKYLGIRLDMIEAEHLRDWLGSLRNPKTKEPMSSVTVKHHRKDVNTFLKRAVVEGWIEKNPCEAVKPPRIDEEPKRPLPPKDIFKLLQANRNEPVVGRLALELFGGLRASSAERLSKDHLKFDAKGIAMPGQKHKSGKWKYRQGHPAVLWDWLNHAPEECWTEVSPKNYGRLKSMAFIRANVPNPGNTLRHSFASYMLARTKDMGKVGYLMQHTRASTTEGYEGVADEADAALVLAMTPEAVSGSWEHFLSAQQPTPTE